MPPNNSFTPEQRLEIKGIVHEALVEYFKGYGLTGKNIIVTTAMIVGAITVILGGVKFLLGLIGFTYIVK